MGGGVQHHPGWKSQQPGCILRPGGSIQGRRRSQASGTGCLKWPEFQVQDRLGRHQANRLRCHVQDPGSWPAVGEQLQSITSSSETPGLGQERSLCSRRDRINAKVPSIHGTLSHQPHTTTAEGLPQPPPPPAPPPPSSGCPRAACDCSPFMLLPLEVRSRGRKEEVKRGKGRDLLPYL